MALDTRLAFKFLQVNYEYGLLDEMGSIVGDALETVMAEQRIDMEDVLNKLDGAGEQTIERIDSLLEKWSNLFFRLAANKSMTRLQAALLRIPAVRRGAVRLAAALLRKGLAPGGAIVRDIDRGGCAGG